MSNLVTPRRTKVFWSGRSQAIRLPKEFRLTTEEVLVHQEGNSLVIEPVDAWPEGWVESFTGVPGDFKRHPQRKTRKRALL